MATKLKKMKLTSVDLVRAGANQEADILLYKSADPQNEPAEGPTETETNLFKRFLGWIRSNPTEGHVEPDSGIQKDYSTFNQITAGQESRDLLWRYTEALTTSIRSIQDDKDLDEEHKKQMMLKSLDEFDGAMEALIDKLCISAPARVNELVKSADPEDDPEEEGEEEAVDFFDDEEDDEEVEKTNPYHGKDGRFTSASGGGTAGAGQATKYHKQCQHIAETVGSRAISGTLSSKKVKEAAERGGGLREFKDKAYHMSPQKDGSITTYVGTKTKSGGLNLEQYAPGFKTLEDAKMWGVGTILNTVGKSDRFDEIDEI